MLSYDDLLSQLADALAELDAPARARMRRRWKFVLIDEFQDTDPVQWQVFQRAFADSTTMVLIGDPKQAIYAFRGGDIVTYLAAADAARTTQTLGVNWRSDQPLLDALQALLEGADARRPAHRRTPRRGTLRGVTTGGRRARRSGSGSYAAHELGKGPRSKPPVAAWREHVITDAAHDIKRLIQSGATFEGRPLVPGDIAVLAARRSELEATQEALAAVGVPSVINAGGSVFHTPAAGEWLTLLEALEQPHRSDRVRAAALTSFFGYSAAELDAGGDDLTDSLADRVRTLTDVLTTRGVAAVLEVTVVAGLTARVLGRVGGERTLTDIRHIGEALHRVSVEDRLGIVGLLGWLREQVADDKLEVASERTRRLDSDAAAVQLVTIHGSKGLQYPVVYLPTLWNRYVGNDPEIPLFHDDEGRRCRDVGGRSPFHRHSVARHWSEDAGESLRLLYVALTRAQSQVVAWYAPAERNTPASPLHRMLFGRRPQARPSCRTSRRWSTRSGCSRSWVTGRPPAARPSSSPTLTPPDPTPLQRSADDARRAGLHADGRHRVAAYVLLLVVGRRVHESQRRRAWSEPMSEPEDRAGDRRRARPGRARCCGRGSGRRRDRGRAVADGRPAGGRHLRLAGARGARARRPRRPRLPGRAARPHRRPAGLVAGRARRRGAGRRAGRRVHEPARARSPTSGRCSTSGCPTGCASWTSSCRSRAATTRPTPRPGSGSATSRRCSGDTCPRATRCCPTPTPSTTTPTWPTSRCGATSPGRSTWCCASPSTGPSGS